MHESNAFRRAADALAMLPRLLVLPVFLWGCGNDTSTPATVTASPRPAPAYPIQGFLPDAASSANATGAALPPPPGASPIGGGEGAENRVDDPSAPPDTPLCGTAAREVAAASAAISPAVMEGGGACSRTTCFDPLTGTYIGADGQRHVCQ